MRLALIAKKFKTNFYYRTVQIENGIKTTEADTGSVL